MPSRPPRPARKSFERLDWPKEMLRVIDADFSQLVSFELGHSALPSKAVRMPTALVSRLRCSRSRANRC